MIRNISKVTAEFMHTEKQNLLARKKLVRCLKKLIVFEITAQFFGLNQQINLFGEPFSVGWSANQISGGPTDFVFRYKFCNFRKKIGMAENF
jgi:hypothetical protein